MEKFTTWFNTDDDFNEEIGELLLDKLKSFVELAKVRVDAIDYWAEWYKKTNALLTYLDRENDAACDKLFNLLRSELSIDGKMGGKLKVHDIVVPECFIVNSELGEAIIIFLNYFEIRFMLYARVHVSREETELNFIVGEDLIETLYNQSTSTVAKHQ